MGKENKERIPKNQGIRSSDITKYEKQGITLLAAQLANDDSIEDYWLITNPASIDNFGHVIVAITDIYQNKYLLLVETNLRTTKRMRFVTDPDIERNDRECDMPLYKYLRSYNNILNLDINNELKEKFQDIPRENFYFCIFTTMPGEITMQLKNKEMVNVRLSEKNINGNILNCFGSYAQCPESPKHFSGEYKEFLKQFYIFADQPNPQSIYAELQEHIGKSTDGTVDDLCDVIDSTMTDDDCCLPLTKLVFLEKCLEAQLSHIILS